ncbi:MAG TPA: hypothetical protein VN725_02150 [Rhodanobacteraceae bacterium]|nr:hypothetical protein [Rhodanobacteraceae bacterium]
MPATSMLARAIALALLGVAGAVSAAPQVDPTQDAAQDTQMQPLVAPQTAPTQDTQAQPLIAPPQPAQEQDQDIEPIGPPSAPPEVPPANVPLFGYTLEAGVEHSSNINLSEDNPVSQTLLVPRASFTYDQSGSTLQAHVVGQVEYIDYLEGDFDNQLRGALAGSLNWNIVPQRLAFSVIDTSTVQSVSILASNAPGNEQQVNVLSAGPVFSFRLGGTWHGQLEAHYINTIASESKGFDSQRELGVFRLIDDLNATDQLSGNVEAEHVHLQNPELVIGPVRNGYDRYDAYAHYVSNLVNHVTVDLTLGGSRYSFGNGFPDKSGVLARAHVDWRVDAHNSLSLGGARQLADAAEDMLLYPDQLLAIQEVGAGDLLGLNVGNNVVTPDVYRESLLDANYAWQGDRLHLSIGPYYRRVNYLGDTTLNRNEGGAGLDLSWRMTPLMTLGFGAGVARTHYTTLARRDTTYGFGPNLTDQLTQHWSWRASLTHGHRNSTEAGHGYNDNVAFFVLSYKR